MAAEIRPDPLGRFEVICAPERLLRPGASRPPQPWPAAHGKCAFCRGSEAQTPAAVAVYPGGAPADWQVRVIPNRYPAVRPPTEELLIGPPLPSEPWWDFHASAPAVGRHEVVVETPDHRTRAVDVPLANRVLTIQCWRDRLTAWRNSPLRYAVPFCNQGLDAGSSMAHVHSQLIGLEHTPLAVRRWLESAACYHQKHDTCYWCRLAETELDAGDRVVHLTNDFLIFCPFAARVPLELCILPRHHASHFDLDPHCSSQQLAEIIQSTLTQLEYSGHATAFNLVIQSAPFDSPPNDHYHWHIEILPRQTSQAGFEWGTGCFINPMPPEHAAQILRGAGWVPRGQNR